MILRCKLEVLKQVLQESRVSKAKEVVLFFQQKPSLHLIHKEAIRSWSLEIEDQDEPLATGIEIGISSIQKILSACALQATTDVRFYVEGSRLFCVCVQRNIQITCLKYKESDYLQREYKEGCDVSLSHFKEIFESVWKAVDEKPIHIVSFLRDLNIHNNYKGEYLVGGIVNIQKSSVVEEFSFALDKRGSGNLRVFLQNEEYGQILRVSTQKGFATVFENLSNGNTLTVSHQVCSHDVLKDFNPLTSLLLFCSHKKTKETFFDVLENHLEKRLKMGKREKLGSATLRLRSFSEKEPSFVGRLEMSFRSTITGKEETIYFPVKTETPMDTLSYLGSYIMNDLLMLFSLLNPNKAIRLNYNNPFLSFFQDDFLFVIRRLKT